MTNEPASGVATGGARGQSDTPCSEKFAKNREKEGKNQEKSGKRAKIGKKRQKLGKFCSVCPQGLATLLEPALHSLKLGQRYRNTFPMHHVNMRNILERCLID